MVNESKTLNLAENAASDQKQASLSEFLEESLRLYRIEPVGKILSDQLHLPLGIIWFSFLFLNYLYLAAQYDNSRNALEILPEFFASLNLFLIVVEIIGKPLLFTLLIYYRSSIPSQLMQLERSGFIKQKSPSNKILLYSRNKAIQIFAIIILPILYGILSAITNTPKDIPIIFGLVIFIGTYARTAVFVQVVYIFAILVNYEFSFKLQINHPDRCSGLSPFGNLAIFAYFYFFILAMRQSVITAIGGGGTTRLLHDSFGINTIYLWLIFPVIFIITFDQLILKPHRHLKILQNQYLNMMSLKLMDYHQQIVTNITSTTPQLQEKPRTSGLNERV